MADPFEHPVQQPIKSITIVEWSDGWEGYRVGQKGVTRIEAVTKSGMHANIPYIRVWTGDTCLMEVCQHNIMGVYFEPAPAEGGA